MKPIFSIVILVHDRPTELISRCIQSIEKHTDYNDTPYQIVIVNQGLSEPSFLYDCASTLLNCKIINLKENVGVSAGRNVGIKACIGEYIVFIDDDAYITTHKWLNNMLRYFVNDDKIGMLGQFGYYTNNNFTSFQFAYGETECDAVAGFCQAFPISLIESIGYLDEGFGRFWHEDQDWCYRIREAGYKVIKMNESGVFHKFSKSGDDGSYRDKLTYLYNKWKGKTDILVKPYLRNKPYFLQGEKDVKN